MVRVADGGDRSGIRNCDCANCRGGPWYFSLYFRTRETDRRLIEKRTVIRKVRHLQLKCNR